MLKNPHAEASANGSSIPARGTSPLTASTEQIIQADSGYQGDSPPEQTSTKPLTRREKVKIIQAAIQKTVDISLSTWGHIDLAQLINYEQHDSMDINDGIRFFRELLLFVADPSIAGVFQKEVRDGLDTVRKLMRFFDGLNDNDCYDEWTEYAFIDSPDSTDEDIRTYTKRYLTGTELEMVLSDPDETKSSSPALKRPWYMTPEVELPTLTDDELVSALERYYPGKQWPADKKTIATHEKMRSSLTWREKERLSLLYETPEQKQKRLIDAAVHSVINGPSLPEQIRAVGEKVEAVVKAPKVLGPDTEIQFRMDKVKMQPLTMEPEEKKPGKPALKKGSATPSKRPAPSKKSSTAKKPASKPASPKKKA